jgi:Kdo2-lipid IVA lauroyltransferase/acyltransferase
MANAPEKKTFPIGKRISHVFEFMFLMIFFVLINLLPFSALHGVARFFRIILSPLLKSAKKRIRTQVTDVLKITDEAELKTFINHNLDNTIRSFFELMQGWRMRRPRFVRKYVEITPETRAILAESSEGIVFAEGHFGNWEVPVPAFASLGVKVFFSAQKLSNPYVDAMTHWIRMRYGGGGVVYLKEAEKFIPLLRRKEPIGLVSDQDAGTDGIFVNFLGKPAATHTGPAVLAYLGKARLVFAFCVYQGRGRYRIDCKSLYRFQGKSDFKSSKEAAEILTNRWMHELEAEVRKVPEQYFWAHRRWKTRPPGEHPC